MDSKASLSALANSIHTCSRCPRLLQHCQAIAQTKKRAFLDQTYWGKPISGFGDPHARLMIVGLAPAAHGANRTGRIFTGDRSGDWLYSTLHRFGFANQPHSTSRDDGLELQDTYITCVVKCAPPDNKPTPQEQKSCSDFLKKELEAMPQTRVWIALGQIALNALWPMLSGLASPDCPQARPQFKHGAEIDLGANRFLLLSYHPSQQNTFTGRLTVPMFHSVFARAKALLTNKNSNPIA